MCVCVCVLVNIYDAVDAADPARYGGFGFISELFIYSFDSGVVSERIVLIRIWLKYLNEEGV